MQCSAVTGCFPTTVNCITTDGILLNGHHRDERGTIETSQDFWVWEGCPADAQMVNNMGNKRDAADNATAQDPVGRQHLSR